MNLVLQITRGPRRGTRRVLQAGQRAVIGAANWSDFPCHDSAMDDTQFLVKCLRSAGWVQNLSGSVKLMVNGVVVQKKRLGQGDIVTAGNCDFLASIRRHEGVFEDLKIPLVGTDDFAQQFNRRIVAPRISKVGLIPDRNTVFPEAWAESVRLKNEGKGIPSLGLLKSLATNGKAGLLIDTSAAPDVFAADSPVRPEHMIPLSSPEDRQCYLFLVDSQPLADLHRLLSRLWLDGRVIFFVPIDATLRHRNRFSESSLWRGRTAGQISGLLTDGPASLQEGVFRYLESVLLPNDVGWTLLSRAAISYDQLHRSSA
ncbi:MAG: hypothetical protein R3C59_17540 [Planctomycetaceae bacterium]